jgi:oxygen-independent coproporphyrinogen-3 oxidase
VERPRIEFDAGLVRRFDRNGPRYTSYPTADRFAADFDAAAYADWAGRRSIGGAERPLALYVHLPFCRDVCFYCACNKIVTRNAGKAAQYLEYLAREIDMQAALFSGDRRITQMHWGGGTPTYHDLEDLRALFLRLEERFDFSPRGEYSIEADPRTVDAAAVHALHEMGFNRVSFGVQDFDPRVQVAVHRLQSEQETCGVIEAARQEGFESVNVDLIYGLPKQTLLSFDDTMARILKLKPDRVAIYNYAHLPHVFKPQRRIGDGDLPSPETRLELLGLAIRQMEAAGYVHLGMDHFALPGDALAVAQRQGRMHRNFQGYSAIADADLVGLGVSAIGAIGPTYSQNHRALEDYYRELDGGRLPVMRGVLLSPDDLLRRSVIQALMCNFALSKQALEVAYLIDFDSYFSVELAELREFEDLGLVTLKDDWLGVTAKGRFLIRSICMVFDRYLRQGRDSPRYSRVV